MTTKQKTNAASTPLQKGRRIRYRSRLGTITRVSDDSVRVMMDDSPRTQPYLLDEIELLPVDFPAA